MTLTTRRTAALFIITCAVVPACGSLGDAPPGGVPTMGTSETWYKGVANTVEIEWPGPACSNPWSTDCPATPDILLRVDAVSCDGCQITADPSGGESGGGATIGATATRVGDISFAATITYVPTGESETLRTAVHVDDEVALSATCSIIETSDVASFVQNGGDDLYMRACGATRHSTESIILAPVVTTLDGDTIDPFLETGAVSLGSVYPVQPQASITVTPPPTQWAIGPSAIYTQPGVASVTLSAPLTNGTTSTVTVQLPACDGSPGCV